MISSNIVFTAEDRAKFREIALVLEKELRAEGKNSKELARFSEYPPLVEAIRLAKDNMISAPLELENMNYWYFESPLGEWFHFSTSKARYALSDFIRLISGFPLVESKVEDQKKIGN